MNADQAYIEVRDVDIFIFIMTAKCLLIDFDDSHLMGSGKAI